MTTKSPGPQPSKSKSLLSSSAEGAKFLILLQVSSRLLTFGVNQLLLRYLFTRVTSISVQLELLTISILYFSRESLRNALQRQSSALKLPYGAVGVALYVVATILELASEPAPRWAESAAAFTRCVLTCGITVGYGAVLLVVYGMKTWKASKEEGFGIGLVKIEGEKRDKYYGGYFNKPLSSLAATIPGCLPLAANYGSLIARMLFQPLEESSRNLFSKLLLAENKNKASVTSASQILKTITKLYLFLSIFFAVLGRHSLHVLLLLHPPLAINGITESFVQSVATASELRRQSAWMFSFSLGLASRGYVFVRSLAMGAQGLVWANVVNMALRITWSSVFIRRFLRAARGQGGLPVVAELGLVRQMAMAAGAGGVMIVACAVTERGFFRECWNMIRTGR
ncbi:Rft protein-domain-containing protein [Trichophaea hybrida]|nr:Rft protein-domain-containing protein [Trichophaea hybrida]